MTDQNPAASSGPARPARPVAAPADLPMAAPLAPKTAPVDAPLAAPIAAPIAAPVAPKVPMAAPVAPPTDGAPRPVAAPAATATPVRLATRAKRTVDIDKLLRDLVAAGGSDLHLSVTSKPLMRINGDITPVDDHAILDGDDLHDALYDLLSPEQQGYFDREWELDFAYTVNGVGRFRANLYKQRGVPGAVFREIPTEIKPLETLGLPSTLYQFAGLPRGLVLVTGPTGSGKSTTLASLIDHANRTRKTHIMTIEDPIEFLHPNRMSVVNQREVGTDTHSFAHALKHVLRQDPDIILIGELRDLETISTALTAAETGHLVFATLHTQSAQDTVNRIIDVFPSEQQAQIRSQLAATLRGVVCQTLLKRADRKGRIAACEIMVVNTGIAQMIRRGETHQIPSSIQAGGDLGMQTLNQHLAELVTRGIVERETAEEMASDVKDLHTLMGGSAKRQPNLANLDGMGSSLGGFRPGAGR